MKLRNLLIGFFVGVTTLGSSYCFAAEGDTTIITTHNNQILDWYGNFDSTAMFPDHSVSYRKVYLEFELGKYHCEGYDPNNAGEGEGKTGWCADWDYDVHIIAMTPGGDTVELAELITPYANSNFPAVYGWGWKHPYIFDVTDYYPILKDEVTIRIFYSGYSGGFTGTVRFYFIEGTPARNVVHIEKLYHGAYAYGLADDPIEEKVDERTITFPADAQSGVLRTIITGHGGIATENCSEFCKKWLRYKINGESILQKDIWRDDCGSNWLAVQSGTWIYDRANWCPGNSVEPWIVPLPSSLEPGSTFNADIDFQPFSTTHSGASYKMSTYVIFYGPYNHDLDIAIEKIISPNKFVEHRHFNPVCGEARFKVKNYGSTTITSLKIGYKIGDDPMAEKDFSLSLQPDQEAELVIDDISTLLTVSATSTFELEILEVNGEVGDDEPLNNKLSTTFEPVPVHTNDWYYVQMRSSGITSVSNPVTWKLIDMNTGTTLYSRTITAPNQTRNDTFRLYNGCYKLTAETPAGYGLSFFGSFAGGYVRMYKLETGTRIAIPGNDMGASGLEGNFGNGYSYYFGVNSPNYANQFEIVHQPQIYPNPTGDYLYIDLNEIGNEASVEIIDLLGNKVIHTQISDGKAYISTQSLAAGIYLVQIASKGKLYKEKLSIVR